MLLDITREELETRTHRMIDLEHHMEVQDTELEERAEMIANLEHHMEVQDTELEERAEMIANLEQQLLELHVQAPPEPPDPEEIDAMLGIDED
jgi:uncharacterized coiled-coil protein SlyX